MGNPRPRYKIEPGAPETKELVAGVVEKNY
jgi:hypothetical protein